MSTADQTTHPETGFLGASGRPLVERNLDRMTAYARSLEAALNATGKNGAHNAIAMLRREHGVQMLLSPVHGKEQR